MGIIKDIFQEHGPEYIARHGDAMPRIHKRVIRAILQCKTEGCGITMFQCENCHTSHFFPLSCGNRHCPNCKDDRGIRWKGKSYDRGYKGGDGTRFTP